MMNKYLIFGVVLILFLSGCYEPLKGDLFDEYSKSVVIEAKLTSQEPPYFIYVSYTAPPDGVLDFIPVNDAIATISNDTGEKVSAEFVEAGKYSLSNWTVQPSNWYHLRVTVEGKVYTADELMPFFPIIDSFQANYRLNFVDGSGYYFKLFIKTKTDTIQYYRAEVWENGLLYNGYSDLLVFDDSYTTGQFAWTAPYAFTFGDSVTIKLHGITENMYKYYYGLNRQTTNNFSNIQPPLLNPPSNINKKPMGYFQVSSVTSIDSVLSEKIQ